MAWRKKHVPYCERSSFLVLHQYQRLPPSSRVLCYFKVVLGELVNGTSLIQEIKVGESTMFEMRRMILQYILLEMKTNQKCFHSSIARAIKALYVCIGHVMELTGDSFASLPQDYRSQQFRAILPHAEKALLQFPMTLPDKKRIVALNDPSNYYDESRYGTPCATEILHRRIIGSFKQRNSTNRVLKDTFIFPKRTSFRA